MEKKEITTKPNEVIKKKVDYSKLSLAHKLWLVSKKIGYLQKDKANKMQHYKYLSEAKVKETIKEWLDEYRVIFFVNSHFISKDELYKTSKATMIGSIIEGTITFINIDKPEETYTMNWTGEGADTGDKGIYKALTGGVRHALATKFLIPTGDDPEDDPKIDEGGINIKPKRMSKEEGAAAIKKKFPGTKEIPNKPIDKPMYLLITLQILKLKS